ncbi:MAG: hypothetical protein M3021_10510 [Actinomycetota bacterium]|nr:hypothetical protein [Actinomycetota bacterium]
MFPLLHAVVMSSHHYLADTPTPGNATLPGNTETQLNTVLGWIKYLGLAACVAGLFLVAGKMAISHRTGGGGEHMSGLGYVAGALVIIGGASSIVSFLVAG